MEQIILNNEDLRLLEEDYPGLTYNKSNNTISGLLSFHRQYKANPPLSGNYHIEFKLEHDNDSILPKVRETKGKILNIAKRKKLPPADLHLNKLNGEMCLIIPIKEIEYYLMVLS